MNDMTPTSGRDFVLPAAVEAYRQDMQDAAMRIQCMVEAIEACMDDPDRRELCVELARNARDAAKKLNIGLDYINFGIKKGKNQ